jgi:ketosteroid isomerase-like protein
MSSVNIDVVRRAMQAFNRGELKTLVQDADPDIVVDWSRSTGLEAGMYLGQQEAARFLATFHDLFERVDSEPQELIAHGDSVLVPTHTRLWGRDGVEVHTRHVALVTVREGRIVLWRLYLDREEALGDLGPDGEP